MHDPTVPLLDIYLEKGKLQFSRSLRPHEKLHLPKKEMLSVRNRIPAGICQDVHVRV